MSFPREDKIKLEERARVGAGIRGFDSFRWICRTRIEKYHVDDFHAGRPPYEVVDVDGNLLLYGGADCLWGGLIKKLSTSSTKFQYFDNAHAALLIGDTTSAAVNTQTDLQASSGATHRWVQGMDATYPVHTTGASTAANAQIQYKATVTSANANFKWGEWGVGNKVSQAKAYPGRLLNRKVQALGTKTSLGIWALTVTLSEA